MAITKNVVEMMNGDILVESCPGKGSVFTVTMPMQPENAQAEEVPGEWIGVHSLIVDDDRQTCENAAELLDNMGLRAEFVTDGRTARVLGSAGQGYGGPLSACYHRLENARYGRRGNCKAYTQ